MAAEWSGYLKRAVATVERHLDEALEKPSKPEPVDGPIETAGNEQKTQDADTPVVDDDLIAGPILNVPNLEPAVASVRQLVLKLESLSDESIKDSGLDAVETVETAVSDHDAFAEQVSQRIASLLSKIKYLSNIKVGQLDASSEAAAKRERQIALLLDEGQRLAQQELKLNMVIKKLRKNQTSSPQPSVIQTAELDRALADLQLEKSRAASHQQALERQIAEKATVEATLRKQIADDAARIEHYRSLAEASGASNETQAGDLQRRLDMARAHHTAAADNWNNIETGLLSRIAELEATLEEDHTQRAALLKKLQTAQQNLTEARDAASESATAVREMESKNTAATRHVQQLEEQVNQLRSDLKAQIAATTQAQQKCETLQTEFASEREEWAAREAELVAAASASQRQSFFESEVSLASIPASESETPPRSPSLSRRQSLCSDVDLSTMMSTTSSVIAPRSESGHILGRLTVTVRRLEAELASTKHALELANSEKTDAYNELLTAMNAGEEAESLRREKSEQADKITKLESTVDNLLVKLGEKSERVQELEADVLDLKEAYREQIEALLK